MNGLLHRIRLRPGLSVEQLARALPTNVYGQHKLVWQWLAGQPGRDFLFRREEREPRPCFYVLSQREAVVSEFWEVETKPFAPQLEPGDRLSFVLRANPVVVRKISDDREVKTRRRDDVIMDWKTRHPDPKTRPPLGQILQEAGAAWLAAKAERNGFKLEQVSADGYRQHRIYKRDAKQPITLSTLEFEGILSVANPGLFVEKLFQGIGPAKGFGCGLLLVRRV